jgi:hypothetical protein
MRMEILNTLRWKAKFALVGKACLALLLVPHRLIDIFL